MTSLPFKFDQIGYWSELKLEIVEKYGAAYTKAFANTRNLKKYYIDAFSGAGVHVSKRTKNRIEGSPARALRITPPFDAFISSISTPARPIIFGPYVAIDPIFTFIPATAINT